MKRGIFILSCFVSIVILMVGCNNIDGNKNSNDTEHNSIENTSEDKADINTEISDENNNNIQNTTLEKIALEEAKNITTKYGYSLISETVTETMVGDSDVFRLIKDASIKGGYSESDLNSMTENRIILEYKLEEKSKKDKPVVLGLVLDNEKVIGAYLDYAGYNPGIKSIDFIADLK